RKVLPSISADKQRIARRKIKHAGIVRKVRGPIHPAGHESRELSESLLAPEIHAPFFRIPRRELQYAKRQRHEIGQTPGDPDHERTRSGSRCSSNPPEAERRHEVEQHKVRKPHCLSQVRGAHGGLILAVEGTDDADKSGMIESNDRPSMLRNTAQS